MSQKGQASGTLYIHPECLMGDGKLFYVEYEYLDSGDVKQDEYNVIALNQDSAIDMFWEFANAWETLGYNHAILACYEIPRG